jgi:hypothetical protein
MITIGLKVSCKQLKFSSFKFSLEKHCAFAGYHVKAFTDAEFYLIDFCERNFADYPQSAVGTKG